MQIQRLNQRELFEVKKGRWRLSVAVRSWRGRRTYIGSINGQVCATAPAKGDLFRLLLEMAPDFPAG